MSDVTEVLSRIEQGDQGAARRLLPLVYRELRQLARSKLRRERPDHSLEATALVHEAYLRLLNSDGSDRKWNCRSHFFAAAAEAMRRILIESVRRKNSQKRSGGHVRIEFSTLNNLGSRRDEKLLALDTALVQLEEIDSIKANLVKLRFFAGLTQAEAAEVLGISMTTADRYWAFSRAFLKSEMRRD